MENIKIKANDDYELSLNIYEVSNAKGYIQVIHGMQEHQMRYEKIALKLNEAGYTVITSDIRGHGPNAPILGYFASIDGYKMVIDDQKLITDFILERYNIEKVIILAHSMGTIIARNLLQTESVNYEKVILSGYPNYQSASNLGILIGKLIKLFKGSKHDSKLLANLSVGSFNKKIKNPRTHLDWLSYNNENVDKYIADPYCGFSFKTSAFIDLFTMLSLMNKAKRFTNVNNIPLLLIAGEDDPCIGGVKGIKNSIDALNKVGFTNIKKITYKMMRHEILNECDAEFVVNDIIIFLR